MTVTGLFGLLCAVQVQAGLLLAPAPLLGVVSWDTLIRISLLGCAWLGLVVAWVFVINVIREKYCQHRQNNREYNQPCGEPFDSLAGDLSPLRKRNLKLGSVSLKLHWVGFIAYQVLKMANPLIHPFGIKLVLEVAHTPNESKLSDSQPGRKP